MALGPMPAGVPGGGLPPTPGAGAPPGAAGGGMPPANVGPHTIPQSNPGNVMQSLHKIQQAAQLIQEALPQIPMGSPLHQKAMKWATDMTKELGDLKANVQQQVQTLMQHLQAQKAAGQTPQMPQAPQPNQPPAMPPPGAAAAA